MLKSLKSAQEPQYKGIIDDVKTFIGIEPDYDDETRKRLAEVDDELKAAMSVRDVKQRAYDQSSSKLRELDSKTQTFEDEMQRFRNKHKNEECRQGWDNDVYPSVESYFNYESSIVKDVDALRSNTDKVVAEMAQISLQGLETFGSTSFSKLSHEEIIESFDRARIPLENLRKCIDNIKQLEQTLKLCENHASNTVQGAVLHVNKTLKSTDVNKSCTATLEKLVDDEDYKSMLHHRLRHSKPDFESFSTYDYGDFYDTVFAESLKIDKKERKDWFAFEEKDRDESYEQQSATIKTVEEKREALRREKVKDHQELREQMKRVTDFETKKSKIKEEWKKAHAST